MKRIIVMAGIFAILVVFESCWKKDEEGRIYNPHISIHFDSVYYMECNVVKEITDDTRKIYTKENVRIYGRIEDDSFPSGDYIWKFERREWDTLCLLYTSPSPRD